MSKRLRFLLFALVCVLRACTVPVAYAQYTPVAGSLTHDASGNLIVSGQVCAQGVNPANNQPIPFNVGGSAGLAIPEPTACANITTGVIASGYQLADSNLTQPKYVAYIFTVTDTVSGNSYTIGPTQVSCTMTPTPNNCSSGTWSLDGYWPSIVPLALQQIGATGPAGAGYINGLTSNGANGINVAGSIAAGEVQAASIEQGANDAAVPVSAVLQNASASTANILFIGDSITAGSGAPSNSQGYANQVSTYLSRYYGGNGTWCPFGSSCAMGMSGSWSGVAGLAANEPSLSTPFYQAYAGTASGTATIPIYDDGWASTLNIYYYTYTDSAAFSVSVDGTTVGTYGGTTTSMYTPATATIPITPSGTGHTIVVTAPSTGHVYLWGYAVTLGAQGLSYSNVAVAGTNSTAWAGDLSWLAFMPIHTFAIVGLGQNDGWSNSTTLIANHAAIHSALAGAGIPEAIIVTEPPQGSTTANDVVVNALISWAQTQGIPVVNIWGSWGSYAAGNALGLYADTIHPSLTGHMDIATRVISRLFPAASSYANFTGNIYHGSQTINLGNFGSFNLTGTQPSLQLIFPGVGTVSWSILGNGQSQVTAPGVINFINGLGATNLTSVTTGALSVSATGNASATIGTTSTTGNSATLNLTSGFSGVSNTAFITSTNGQLQINAGPTGGTNNFMTFYTDNILAGKVTSAQHWLLNSSTDCGQVLCVNGAISEASATMIATTTSFTNGSGSATATLTNGPAAGNPTKWIPISDNGTTRYVPAW
jgi:lysophospholipase L1-like esterase